MNNSEKLDLLHIKMDLMLELMSINPAFIAAAHAKRPRDQWEKVITEYKQIVEKYKEELHAYYDNITSVESEVS